MSEELHPGLHPEADVLNAFLEGALPEHERAACLAHLADCAHCREVVFLAQEATSAEELAAEPVSVKEAPVPFWGKLLRPLPVLAAVLTMVVVFVSVGLYRMVRSDEQKPTAIAQAELPTPPPEPLTEPTAQAGQNAGGQPEPLQSKTVQPAPRKVSPAMQIAGARPPIERVAPPPLPAAAPLGPPPPAPAPVAAPQPASAAAAFRPAVPAGAGVAGTVTDRAGNVIPRAQVELKNDATGATYSAASDTRGQFSIGGMTPGKYDLNITSMGFRHFERPSIDVPPQTMARIDSTLDVGSVAETISVTAEASLLKTETGAVATAQNGAAQALPLNGRTSTLLELAPSYQLPGKKPAATSAAKDPIVVAADADGKLFFSSDQGKSWKNVKGKWKGKVVRVQTRADHLFELTTDQSSTWVSTDGRNWTPVAASR